MYFIKQENVYFLKRLKTGARGLDFKKMFILNEKRVIGWCFLLYLFKKRIMIEIIFFIRKSSRFPTR